jgi:hypothetical protein
MVKQWDVEVFSYSGLGFNAFYGACCTCHEATVLDWCVRRWTNSPAMSHVDHNACSLKCAKALHDKIMSSEHNAKSVMQSYLWPLRSSTSESES